MSAHDEDRLLCVLRSERNEDVCVSTPSGLEDLKIGSMACVSKALGDVGRCSIEILRMGCASRNDLRREKRHVFAEQVVTRTRGKLERKTGDRRLSHEGDEYEDADGDA
jgi:hypothetical protein